MANLCSVMKYFHLFADWRLFVKPIAGSWVLPHPAQQRRKDGRHRHQPSESYQQKGLLEMGQVTVEIAIFHGITLLQPVMTNGYRLKRPRTGCWPFGWAWTIVFVTTTRASSGSRYVLGLEQQQQNLGKSRKPYRNPFQCSPLNKDLHSWSSSPAYLRRLTRGYIRVDAW